MWYHRADLSTDSVERFAAAEAETLDGGAGGGERARAALGRAAALEPVPGTARSVPQGDRLAEAGTALRDYGGGGGGVRGGSGHGDVRPGRFCLPRHSTHFERPFLELNNVL